MNIYIYISKYTSDVVDSDTIASQQFRDWSRCCMCYRFA